MINALTDTEKAMLIEVLWFTKRGEGIVLTNEQITILQSIEDKLKK
jgi:hypothetical protein